MPIAPLNVNRDGDALVDSAHQSNGRVSSSRWRGSPYDLVLRALPYSYRHTTPDAAKAIPLLQKAIELEPTYSAAHAYLAWCHQGRFRYGLREEDRAAAIQHARAAIAQASDNATVLAIAGFIVALNEHDYATGFTMFDRALAVSSGNILALSCSALILSFRSQPEAAIQRAERALRVSPFDPLHYLAYNALAVSHLARGRYEASRDAARLSVQLNPQFAVCHLFLTAALVCLGDKAEAKRGAQRVLELDPGFTIRRVSDRLDFDPLLLEPLANAWREVGLPEG